MNAGFFNTEVSDVFRLLLRAKCHVNFLWKKYFIKENVTISFLNNLGIAVGGVFSGRNNMQLTGKTSAKLSVITSSVKVTSSLCN